MKFNLNKLSKKTKWIISITTVILVAIIGVILYQKNANRIFTQPEYVKEVIIQNENFNNLLDEFLDQAENYNGTMEATKKLEKQPTDLIPSTTAWKPN